MKRVRHFSNGKTLVLHGAGLFLLLLFLMLPAERILANGELTAVCNVTPDTFFTYFDKDGDTAVPKENADLRLSGDFSAGGLGINRIVVDKGVKLYSEGRLDDAGQEEPSASFTGIRFLITASNAAIEKLSIELDEADNAASDVPSSLIEVKGGASALTGVSLEKNVIDFLTGPSTDSYGIRAANAQLSVLDNVIYYGGNTEGTAINRILSAEECKITATGNKSHARLNSVDVAYDPDTFEPTVLSEGVLFQDCEEVSFSDNDFWLLVDAKITEYGYDTLYGVRLTGSKTKKAELTDNELIVSDGGTFVYGISSDVPDSEIKGNTIKVSADYSSFAIELIGSPASTSVRIVDNVMEAEAVLYSYGIYAYAYRGPFKNLILTGNVIKQEAPACFGIQLTAGSQVIEGLKKKDVVCKIEENTLTATGSRLMGMALYVEGSCTVANNIITMPGDNEEVDWNGDNFGILPSYGIYLRGPFEDDGVMSYSIYGNKIEASDTGILAYARAIISGNDIEAGGSWAISCDGTKLEGEKTEPVVTIRGNKLIAKEAEGNAAITSKQISVLIENNSGKTTQSDPVIQDPDNPNPPAPGPSVQPGGKDKQGTGETAKPGETEQKKKLTLTAKNKKFKASARTKKYTVKVKDGRKPVKKLKLKLKINGKTYKATTNAKGVATFKLKKLTKKKKYTAVLSFDGNAAYGKVSKNIKITIK